MKTENTTLESHKRLSESLIWRLQHEAYCQFGPEAWISKGVPSFITSSAYIARQYADVVLGYIRDGLRQGMIDLDHPIYIADLGAGTGRFGYLFIKNLNEGLALLHRADIRIRYIMTDIALSNIQFWRRHPYLQGMINAGMLDFALYHHTDQHKSLELILSGDSLAENTLVNPMVLIGNYFFDTIPQDLFLAKEGRFFDGCLTLTVENNPVTKKIAHTDPAIIDHLNFQIDYEEILDWSRLYPDEPDLVLILQQYAKKFENIPFLFPEGAFRAIRYFQSLTKGRLFLIAGDQGSYNEKQVKELEAPGIAKHGTFSISVNYHAIASYVRAKGGIHFMTTHPDPLFVVMACAFGGNISDYRETAFAFKKSIDQFEPIDYFLLLDYSEKDWKAPNLEFLLLLLKLGNWDPCDFHLLFEGLRAHLPHAKKATKKKLLEAIHKMWDNFYPVSKEQADFIMNMGVILCDMEQWQEAMTFFDRAATLDRDHPLIIKNMQLCRNKLETVI